ncbi:MAG: GDP-mannose 4,6-dehydratase [Bacteroidales bacterium]|nr:GDP-mannose 4,6-dehydratase [Bacteroidales bacterium]
MARRALVFGITGQDGSYLARLLIDKGYEVHGTSRDAEVARLAGLERLGIAGKVRLHSASPTDFRSVMSVVTRAQPHEIYCLWGQSSVGLSFAQPAETIESILLGALNILETVRMIDPAIRVYYAASSECFGDTGGVPADETTAFHPRSPYGVAKAAAFWQVANYREAYGLFATSGILFNHESPLRPARFVTRKIVRGAVAIAAGPSQRLSLGSLDVVRDWGWAPEYVEAMWAMMQADRPDDFVVATGASHSLATFVEAVFAEVGLDWRDHVDHDPALMRPSDIACSRGNAAKAEQVLGWRARVDFAELVRRLVAAELSGMVLPT